MLVLALRHNDSIQYGALPKAFANPLQIYSYREEKKKGFPLVAHKSPSKKLMKNIVRTAHAVEFSLIET